MVSQQPQSHFPSMTLVGQKEIRNARSFSVVAFLQEIVIKTLVFVVVLLEVYYSSPQSA